jgi:SAM-dependent methyltransferase
MMFGLRHTFSYFECDDCGCLQLVELPNEWGPYYPDNYYSHQETGVPIRECRNETLRAKLARKRDGGLLTGHPRFWKYVARFRSRPELESLRNELAIYPIPGIDARVLDVGCGTGLLLRKMANAGFTKLVGVDPYLPSDVSIGPHLRLLARTIEKLDDGNYDLIMMSHSLEHISGQLHTLEVAREKLSPKGICVVRIPMADSDTWREYGTDWVELDAPRHLYLHTRKSIDLASRKAGLRVCKIVYDAVGFVYWGSILYQRDLSLIDPITRDYRKLSLHFTDAELKKYDARAVAANRHRDASRAIIYLCK